MLDTLRHYSRTYVGFECSIWVVGLAWSITSSKLLPKLVGVDISEKVLQAAKFRNPEIDYRHLTDDVLPSRRSVV